MGWVRKSSPSASTVVSTPVYRLRNSSSTAGRLRPWLSAYTWALKRCTSSSDRIGAYCAAPRLSAAPRRSSSTFSQAERCASISLTDQGPSTPGVVLCASLSPLSRVSNSSHSRRISASSSVLVGISVILPQPASFSRRSTSPASTANAASTGSGEVRSMPASFSSSSGCIEPPVLRKAR